MEQIDPLAKQSFPILEFIRQISFWNQVQKNMSMKPSNPHVVYSSLMLGHEKYFGIENQNWEKKKKSSHWSQNVVGQIFQLVIRNMWGEIVYASLQKYKMVLGHTFLFVIYVYIYHHLPYLMKYSSMEGIIVFEPCALCLHKARIISWT